MVTHATPISRQRCVPKRAVTLVYPPPEYPPCVQLAKDVFCGVFDWVFFPGACGSLKMIL